MADYYDTIYRQVVRKLENISARPFSDKDEKLRDYSCAILTRENRNGSIEYELIERGGFICATDQIKQRTGIITIQVDIYKLQNSHYLLQQADILTYQLCSAILYDYSH